MSFADIVNRAARKATPEMQAQIRAMRFAGLRGDDLTADQQRLRADAQAYIAHAVHGITVASWACPCGARYEYPHSSCQACKRPHPRRCVSSGCGVVCHPRDAVTADGLPVVVVPERCQACLSDLSHVAGGRVSRAASYAGSEIDPKARSVATSASWLAQQVEAAAVLEEAVAAGKGSRLWRSDLSDFELAQGGISAWYLWGPTGSGKTSLAAYLVRRAHVDEGLVAAFHWVTQEQMATTYRAQFSDDQDTKFAAVNRWHAWLQSPLLVVDDLFTSRITEGFGEALVALLRERLDHLRPTVVTSNHPPEWALRFPGDVGRLQSRWYSGGLDLHVQGVDARVMVARQARQ